MIYTVETPGVDALCGVFTSKRQLLNIIEHYVENEVYILPDKYSQLILDIKDLRDGGTVETEVFADKDVAQYNTLEQLENGYFSSDEVHTLRIEEWEPNSHRYLVTRQ